MYSHSVFSIESQEQKCGWLSNPTPANVWLQDGDELWVIAQQGAVFASESDFSHINQLFSKEESVVRNNGNYGYTCVCITGLFDKQDQQLNQISYSVNKGLDYCRTLAKLSSITP
jgi:hypothetical protein